MIRITNCLIEALNKYHVLPRFLIIFPDLEIIKFVNYEKYGISKILAMLTEWWVSQIENAVDTKKEDMRSKRSGAVTSLEPKLIWLKMLMRPKRFNAVIDDQTDKFNAILDETLYNTRKMYIGSIDLEEHCFDQLGNLNSRGKVKYWETFDKLIKKFDKQEISLKPTPVISNSKKAKKEMEEFKQAKK